MKRYSAKKTLKAIAIIFTTWLSVILWMIWGSKSIAITKYDIISNKIPKSFQGFRIAQISDYHNGTFNKDNKQLLQKLKECNPNIIVITGDFFDGKKKSNFDKCFEFIKEAVKLAPVYYTTGNHERSLKEYKQLSEQLEEMGVIVLEDKSVSIKKENELIHLIGIHDLNFHKDKTSQGVQKRIENLMKKDTYNILLSHRPEIFEDYVETGVDLVLTGHTHGGQFSIPFIGGVYAPHQGFLPKYDAGLFIENNTNMIISRGLGESSIPLRFNNRIEIVLVELRNE